MNYEPQARTRVVDFAQALSRMDMMLEEFEPKHHSAWANQETLYHLEHGLDHNVDAREMLDPPVDGPSAMDAVNEIEEALTSAALRHVMALEQFLTARRRLPLFPEAESEG